MGRGKVAESSEIAHFRIDTRHKRFLETQAKKLGKKKFSDLARHAIEEYIDRVQEQMELLGPDTKSKLGMPVEAYELVMKNIQESKTPLLRSTSFLGRESGLHEAFEVLDSFVKINHETFFGFPWKSKPDLLEKVNPEVEQKILETKMAIARQYLSFHAWMSKWWAEIQKRQETETASMGFVSKAKLEKALKPERKDKKRTEGK